MPHCKLQHRGFKHGQGHRRGLPCKRCTLGCMTIPEMLNHSNWWQTTQPQQNNCRFQRIRHCEMYRRECMVSFSDDEVERFEKPNVAHEVLVREYISPPSRKSPSPQPSQLSPLHQKPLTRQTPLPTEKLPLRRTSATMSFEYPSNIIQCGDFYKENPCPMCSCGPEGQYHSDNVSKKPLLLQPLMPWAAPSPCKAPSSFQISSACDMPSYETQSDVICDPDENKAGELASFASVSTLPCHQKDSCAPDCIIEMPPCAVASAHVYPNTFRNCPTPNCPNSAVSVELQNYLNISNKVSTAPIEVNKQTYDSTESSKQTACKHCKLCKKVKEIQSCGMVDCHMSPSPSKKKNKRKERTNDERERTKQTEKTNECPLCSSKSLSPSESNEISAFSIAGTTSDVSSSSNPKNEGKCEYKCNIHTKSSTFKKRCWFRKCKVKTRNSKQKKKPTHGEKCLCHIIPEKQQHMSERQHNVEFTLSEHEIPKVFAPNGEAMQDEFKINASNGNKSTTEGYPPHGQNMYSQLPQAGQIPHGQLFTSGQPYQEQSPGLSTSKIHTPRYQLAASMQTFPDVASQAVQIPMSHFGQQEQLPQSQEFASEFQTQRGIFSQSPQSPLNNFIPSREQLPRYQLAPGGEMPKRQFFSQMETLPSQFYPQDQFNRQQISQSKLVSFPQNQFTSFASSGQVPRVNFARSGQTSQSEYSGGYYQRNQHTPDGQNQQAQFNPGHRQFVSGEQYTRSQSAQTPQCEFVPLGHLPQSKFLPGGQNLQGQFASGQRLQNEFIPAGHIPQSQFISGGQNLPGQLASGQTPQNEFVPAGHIPESKFNLGVQNQAGQFTPGRIPLCCVPSQFAAGRQPNQFEQIPQGEFVPGGHISHSQFTLDGYDHQVYPQNQYIPNNQTLSSHFTPDRKFGENFIKNQFTPGPWPERGQSQFGGTAPQSQFPTRPINDGGDSSHYSSANNFSPGKVPPYLQEPTQFYAGHPGQFPPTQLVSGGEIPSRHVHSGSQMTPSQLVSEGPFPTRISYFTGHFPGNQYTATELPQDRIGPQSLNKQEVVSQVGAPLDQLTATRPVPPSQFVSGGQRPSRQAPLEGQIPQNQSVSVGQIPTGLASTGGRAPSNQYTSTELPQNRISSESNRQKLTSQVGTSPHQFDPRNLDTANQGDPKVQISPGSPPYYSEGKVITTNISPSSSTSKTLSNFFAGERTDKFGCSCCCSKKETAPKYCQHLCVQSTKGYQILPIQSVSREQIPSNFHTSAGIPSVQFSPGCSRRKDQDIEAETLSDHNRPECLNKKNGVILIRCSNLEGNLCNCADTTCNCSVLDDRDKDTPKNKKTSKCQDACDQCEQTWCPRNLVINTSLYKIQHPNTVPVVKTTEVNDNLTAIPKSNAYCECHYPPMFRHFRCTGNASGICKCHEVQHE